jgi:hypothetical protein
MRKQGVSHKAQAMQRKYGKIKAQAGKNERMERRK